MYEWKLNVTYANMYIFPDMCSINEHAESLKKKKRAPRDIVMQGIDNYDYDEDQQRLIKTEAYNKQEMRQIYWEYNFVYWCTFYCNVTIFYMY